MAEGQQGGVRWWIKTALDRSSLTKAKKEMRSALRDGTDAAGARRNLSIVERGFDRIRGAAGRLKSMLFSVQGVLAGLGLGIGAGAAFKFLTDTNRQFESLIAQLKVLEGTESGARAVFRAIEEFAQKTPFQIEELTESYIRLRTAGIQPTEAMMTAFGDLASARGKSVLDFAMAVEDAVTGEMERLKEFGIKASQSGDRVAFTFNGVTTEVENTQSAIVAYLESVGRAEVVQGSMEEQMNTLNGAISNLWDSLGKIARRIGDEGGANAVMKEMADTAGDFADEVERGNTNVKAWVLGAVAIGRTVSNLVEIVWNMIQQVYYGLKGLLFSASAVLAAMINAVGFGLNQLIDLVDQIPGFSLDFRFGGMPAEEWADVAVESFGKVVDNMRDGSKDIMDVVDAWAAVARAAREAGQAQEEASSWGSNTDQGGDEEGGGKRGAYGWASGISGRVPDLRGGYGEHTTSTMPVLTFGQIAAQSRGDDAGASYWEEVAGHAVSASSRMTGAFEGFFSALFSGFDTTEEGFHSLGAAAVGVGASIVAALAEGMAEYHTAQGVGKLAEGGWPPNPEAIRSALLHFAAAGLFAALGSAVSTAGRSPAVPASASSYSQSAAARRAERAEIMAPEVHVWMNPFDPSNPAQAKLVHQGSELGRQLVGKNARLRVHPWPGSMP